MAFALYCLAGLCIAVGIAFALRKSQLKWVRVAAMAIWLGGWGFQYVAWGVRSLQTPPEAVSAASVAFASDDAYLVRYATERVSPAEIQMLVSTRELPPLSNSGLYRVVLRRTDSKWFMTSRTAIIAMRGNAQGQTFPPFPVF